MSTISASPSVGAPATAAKAPSPALILLALAAHAPLALAMQSSRTLATAHALLTVLAMIWILASARTPGPVVGIAAYITGAEVLWRQTAAEIPWELAKYLLIIIFTVGILRFVGKPRQSTKVYLFLAALLPACVVPVVMLGAQGAIDPVSFNLGGLIALALGVLFISQLAGTWASVEPTLWALVAPVLGIATLTANSVRTLGASDFFNDSNFKSSAGFGPNQVSAVLGLGALFLLLIAIREHRLVLEVTALALAIWFLAQALLTFSRGGVANVVIAMLVATPHLLRRRDTATRILTAVLVIGFLAVLVILPRLETFTGGTLETRFTNTHEADQRSFLAHKDYETFQEHPLLGVGVGQSEYYRLQRRVIASHTEYTRLLAEHGLFGIVAMCCLVAMVVSAYRRQISPYGHAWTAALVAWTLVELSHSSTRLSAISFVFALATFTIVTDRPAADPAQLAP